MFVFYRWEVKGGPVKDGVAIRWLRFADVLVRSCQIEVTSGIFGNGGADDGEAAAPVDRYFVGGVDHHGVRRGQGDTGGLQFYCRNRGGFLLLYSSDSL